MNYDGRSARLLENLDENEVARAENKRRSDARISGGLICSQFNVNRLDRLVANPALGVFTGVQQAAQTFR